MCMLVQGVSFVTVTKHKASFICPSENEINMQMETSPSNKLAHFFAFHLSPHFALQAKLRASQYSISRIA